AFATLTIQNGETYTLSAGETLSVDNPYSQSRYAIQNIIQSGRI
ncbi:unnamed protein product, partial [marine sediment metagenome]